MRWPAWLRTRRVVTEFKAEARFEDIKAVQIDDRGDIWISKAEL